MMAYYTIVREDFIIPFVETLNVLESYMAAPPHPYKTSSGSPSVGFVKEKYRYSFRTACYDYLKENSELKKVTPSEFLIIVYEYIA